MKTAKFGVLRYQPYPNRTEHINIGIVTFSDDGLRVHLAKNLRKLKSFDPQADLLAMRDQESEIPKLFKDMTNEQAHVLLQNFGAWRIPTELGFFSYSNEEDYFLWVDRMLESTSEPRNKSRSIDRPIKSKLSIDLKNTFNGLGWIGKKTSDINHDKIVTHYPVSIDDDVYAEFALKNGKLNIIETVDFRHISNITNKRQETQSKALIFNLAEMLEQEKGTNNIVIVAANDYKDVKPMMNLLGRYATIKAWDSQSDMDGFFSHVAKALHKPMLEMPPM